MFSCISSGCCCSKTLCETWSNYFSDLNGCRSIGAVDRVTTEVLSYVPFVGLSNFYMGYKFNGFCELFNAVMMIISILGACSCHKRGSDAIGGYIGIFTVILDLVKIIHMFTMGSADTYEIVLMIISIALIYLYCSSCVDCTNDEAYCIILAIFVTVATGILETVRDVYVAAYYDRDGNDCPFI